MHISDHQKTIKQYLNQLNLKDVIHEKYIQQLSLHHYGANEWLIHASSEVDYLYVVIEGRAGVTPASEDGKISLLDFILPLDIIGDLEYFTNDTYYHSVITLNDCTLLAIPVGLIDPIGTNNGAFYKYICHNLASKMKRTSMQFSSALLYPLKSRLAKYFYDLATYQESTSIPISSTQLASYFGITPRHFRRVLSEFEDEGLILRSSTGLVIQKMDALKSMSTH